MRHAMRWMAIGLGVFSLMAAAPATQPAKKSPAVTAPPVRKPPTTRRAADTKNAALDHAVAALFKEYSAHQRDEKSPLRKECDFFKTDSKTDISDEAVAAALNRSLGGPSEAQAYIKWQLLSAVADKFSDAAAVAALDAYADAPRPHPLPGATAASLRAMERQLARAGQDDVAAINEELKSENERIGALNAPTLAYRTELFKRLPPSYDVLEAGLRDAYERDEAGCDPAEVLQLVTAAIPAWAAAAPPRDRAALGRLLAEMSNEPGTSVVSAAQWNAKTRTVSFKTTSSWAKAKTTLEGALKALENQEEKSAEQPPKKVKPAGGGRKGK